MKKILAVAALSFAAMGAQAQTYNLTSVVTTVPFGSAPADSFNAGATAVVSGNAVSVFDMGYGSLNQNATYNYSGGNWTTEIGDNVDVTKLSESCTQGPGDNCTNAYNGVLGDWISGLDMTGAASAFDFVNVGINGDQLTIVRSTRFVGDPTSAFFNFAKTDTFTFTVVPVPAAAWLFVSALGLMGWIRRRANAA